MKKLILIFIIAAGTINGQEKAVTESGKHVILNNDNTWRLDENEKTGLLPDYFKSDTDKIIVGLFKKVQIPVNNGEDKSVNVNFEFIASKAEYAQISIEKIQNIIDYSRDFLMLNLKNKYSFVPRKISISYSDNRKAWAVIWTYTAKNSYGGEVEGNQTFLYDSEGKRVEI